MPRRRARSPAKFLYLTTTGRVSGLPREIEIWYVEDEGRYYVLSYIGEKAQWVKNIRRNPRVRVRVGKQEFAARARVLDPTRDAERFRRAQQLSEAKYDWGDGLPVELTLEPEA